jgi:hypothetical protein
MKRFFFSVALCVTVLTGLNTAQAFEKGSPRGDRSSYHMRYGTKFDHGYFYRGREHKHWSSRYFDKRFDCYLYHCPSTQCYYYWCERDVCYYPISYCPYNTYNFGTGCVCSSCPVYHPTKPPVYKDPGHGPIWGGNPPRGPGGHGPIWGGNPPRAPGNPIGGIIAKDPGLLNQLTQSEVGRERTSTVAKGGSTARHK